MDKSALEAARNVALRFLGHSARSEAEIERRLAKDEYAPEIIAAVIAECRERGWLDDAQFARDWVEDRADRKLYGRGRLKAELRNRGVDRDSVDAALDTIDNEAELVRARAAAAQKWRGDALAKADRETLQAEKRKLAGFLQRRGFSWQIITQVLAECVPEGE